MTGQAERAIRSILVVGNGLAGLSAALAFARALPQVKVSVLSVALDPAALVERFSTTLPAVGRFHAAVGLDEIELVRRGIAVHHLGTRFENWSADGAAWVHAFGQYGVPEWPVLFHDLWARAKKAGRALAYHRYSAAAVLAESDKFVHPREGQWPLSTYRYALRLDGEAYRSLFEERARAAGVNFLDKGWGGVERRDDGGLAALLLDDGERVEADLFVDCSGPQALLLREMSTKFESWADLFPFDAIRIEQGEGRASPTDTVSASPTGWTWSQPFPRGSVLATASSAGEAVPGEGEAVEVAFGRRPSPWLANVVAIGDSAATLDPLHGANLHLAQSAILRAIELLPGRDCQPVELSEYNRRSEQEVGRVRDFLALHYVRSGRSEGDGWRRAGSAPLPPSLGHTLDQFQARSRLPFYEEETFTRDSWTAVLLGMGLLPRGSDPVAGKFPFEESVEAMDRLAEQLRALPERLPPYSEYLGRMQMDRRQSAGR